MILAGIMVASLVSTILIKLMNPQTTLSVAVGLFSIWFLGLLAYWYWFIAPAYEKYSKSSKSNLNDEMEATSSTDPSSTAVKAWMKRKLDKDGRTDSRLPLTIVTGFLGSGKTTLVKNILGNTVGMKVLVIENEIGAEGIDHELLMQHTGKEEIILMNNGCVCCTGLFMF